MIADVDEDDAAVEWDRAVCPNCLYWKRQTERAINKRTRLEHVFESIDGGAKHWRAIAKETHSKLRDAQDILKRRVLTSVERRTFEANAKWVELVARTGKRDEAIELAKRDLWSAWDSLDDANPAKDAIRKVWEQL